MCLTATANKSVVDDSMKIMEMRPNTYRHTQSFNRPNLSYEVRKKGTGKELLTEIANLIKSRKKLSGIVYCLSRKDCENLSEGRT